MDAKTLTALLAVVAAIALAFTALLLPPPGIIDESALILIAQILVFAASIFGIDAAIISKLKISKLGSEERVLNKSNSQKLPSSEQNQPS